MNLKDLLKRRILLFTGKGGVGKSTVVAAMASYAASVGKKALVVEIDTESAMKRIFAASFVGFVPIEVKNGIWAININPEEALLEYFEEHVKSKRLAKIIANNSILQYFFKTAPAVNEFVTINKLYSLMNEKIKSTNTFNYDILLVDMPATGHALTFLKLPTNLKQLIGVGPLRKLIDKYQYLFTDEKTTALNFVTLPEEMPITETVELYQTVREIDDIPMGMLFVNSVPQSLFNKDEGQVIEKLNEISEKPSKINNIIETGLNAYNRQKKIESLINQLKTSVFMELIRLPKYLVPTFNLQTLENMAGVLETAAKESA